MSSKQDRAAPRTVADIERKYNFGKSFAEVMGIAEDTRNEVDSVYSKLSKDIEQSTELSRSTSEIALKATETAQQIEANVNESLSGVNENIDTLTNTIQSVEAKVTAESLSITVQEEIAKGVDKVEIKGKDYVFDSEGLKINETGSGMSNLLNNEGMYVRQDGKNILVADSKGVTAKDLHAETFLKIGSGDGRCRFEDYDINGINRIGCFWTGG